MAAGEEYVAAITALESDRGARRAFQDLALELAPPGTALFDFGAGPGIDAKHYAARGRKVLAYDVDSRMCAAFVRHCRDEIAAGQIELHQGGYREFLEVTSRKLRQLNEITLVTANFAPLSLIDDPAELFAVLRALTVPNAKFLASVLNPVFSGDLKYRWWWRNRFSYWRDGEFKVKGEPFSIFRRSIRRLATLAAPHFALQSVTPSSGSRLPMSSRYIFLLFARM